MPRRAATLLLVAAGLLLGACGSAARVQTLDREPDLAGTVAPDGLRGSTASDLKLLVRPCQLLTMKVDEYLTGSVAPLQISDVQCHWTAGNPIGPRGGAPEIVLGIVEGGAYRFHETEKILHDDRRIGGVGTDALYAPPSRTVFCVRHGRLWYVQMVGVWAPKYNPQVVTSTLALRLMNERETA